MTLTLSAAIFDVDGVLVASPHERAWREALVGLADPERFTTELYQAHVAGKPRMSGARAALEALGVSNAAERAIDYATVKQALIDRLIAEGSFEAFPDAVRLAGALHDAGLQLALASSSKNADAMLQHVKLEDGRELLSVFDADLSGRDVPRGKPDPALFLLAAEELGVPPQQCLVVEDAPAGVEAAKAGGMAALGIARLGDEALLHGAGADLVVTSLDQLDLGGVGAGVLHTRPVAETAAAHEILEPTQEPNWVLSHHGYSVLTENIVESRFALGNGFMGMRAARPISRGPTWVSWLGYMRWASWPRFYVAGLFDTPNMEPPVPALVPVADWSRIRILLDGEVLLRHEGELLAGVRRLDMRRGELSSNWSLRTAAGVTVTGGELRLLSLADRAAALQFLRLAIDRDGVDVCVDASFELSGLGMEPTRLEQNLGAWRTEGTRKGVAMAADASLNLGGQQMAPEHPFPLRWAWRWRSVAGQPVEFARLVGVARTDAPQEDPSSAASTALARSRARGWRSVVAAHEAAWSDRWAISDVVIDGDDDLQRAVRFAVYHLTSAANPEDDHVSVGARALTGDAYLGHVFWDTEIYLLPFYTAVWPEAARALLMYRFHTLPAARAKAARFGFKGALYAWESADTGRETTPEHLVGANGEQIDILCGVMEQHVSADIAHAVWRYWRASADDEFFLSAGAEIVLETARFWASRAVPETDGKRHIRHVIGPDEYHEDVDDNAFTNVMARWNIARGLEVLELLSRRWPERSAALSQKLGIADHEVADWRDAVDRIVTGLDPATGLYEEFAGFHALDPFDLASLEPRTQPVDVLIGRERTQASQVVKQADVVALLALLPEVFPGAMAETNFRHYEPRCGHGSSLSPAMHALVAARLGDTEMALRYLHDIVDFDPDPTAAGGVRIAGVGGIWQAIVLGFGGLDLSGEAPRIEPNLPAHWRSLSYRVRFRGRLLDIRIADGAVEATLAEGAAIELRMAGATRRVAPGETARVSATEQVLA